MNRRLDGKIAIITGGLSGIGRAIALRFVQEGAVVVTTGSAAADQMEPLAARATVLRHDVTSEQSWHEVIGHTLSAHGRLDILVNTAGPFLLKPIQDTTVADWDFLWTANVDGTFLGTKLAMLAMKQQATGGVIINMSSLMGLVGVANATACSAAKGAITHFTRAAAADGALDEPRIRVNVIHPGMIRTGMPIAQDSPADHSENDLIRQTPLKRAGRPEDVAGAAVYLASDSARYVTGASLTIDGGRCAE